MTQNTNPLLHDGDKKILRDLACKVAELASRPIEDEKRTLWYKHNALEATRPLIFCDPENGWSEIIRKDQLKCKSEVGQCWEKYLRKEIFWGEQMGDDRVIEPTFNVYYVFKVGSWGLDTIFKKVQEGGSYSWDAPLKDYSDFDKLVFPDLHIDYEETSRQLEAAKESFGDLLDVRLEGGWWWTLGLTSSLVFLRGLEQIMYDVYDYPDELHALMGFLRDGTMKRLDFLESNNLLSLNNRSYVGSGGFGYTHELPQPDFDGKHVRTTDMWGFSESQETVQISPQNFEEFVFPYQLPILERFGLNCYGCCEPLDKRWHIIKNIPRLRRVSVSPWANIEDLAEKLGGNYVYSMKPIPTDLAVPHMDKEHVRNKLRDAIMATRNCRVEIIMKDNNTIGNNPQNVIDWCKIAREEAESI